MPPDPRLDDCVALRYSILRPRARPEWARTELPERIVSGSRCLNADLTDVWLDAWREREGDMEGVYRQASDEWGIDRQGVDALCLRYQTDREMDVHGIRSRSAAQEIARQLLSARPDAVIVGFGLPRECVEEVVAVASAGGAEGPPAMINQYIVDALEREQPLEAGATVLGFEPLVIDASLSCSWLCNGIDRAAAEKLGIGTNAFGLIERREDADRVVRYIREDGHAEPGLWLPWLLVRYDR
jgi:hypothetical protein